MQVKVDGEDVSSHIIRQTTSQVGIAYWVSFDGDVAYYNTFLPTAQKIVDSFRITK